MIYSTAVSRSRRQSTRSRPRESRTFRAQTTRVLSSLSPKRDCSLNWVDAPTLLPVSCLVMLDYSMGAATRNIYVRAYSEQKQYNITVKPSSFNPSKDCRAAWGTNRSNIQAVCPQNETAIQKAIQKGIT